MSYELAFLDDALKEWRRLDSALRNQFKKKLADRIANPRVLASRLSGAKDRYKIKLRGDGPHTTGGAKQGRLNSCEWTWPRG